MRYKIYLMWKKNDDGVVLDDNGNPMYIPLDVFKNICGSNRCFVCGALPTEEEFNDEHVFPNWLLKDLKLFSKTLTLTNKELVKYSTYKMRCCKPCNSRLSKHYEDPVSTILRNHGKGKFLSYDEKFLLYRWMALISLKVHMRDRGNPEKLNNSIASKKLADDYDWSLFHHVHALVASGLNATECDPLTFGTFFFAPFKDLFDEDTFDYADVLQGQCVMLRYKDMCYFAALDDARHSGWRLSHIFERIDGPINGLQARELLAELAFVRSHLSDVPVFSTYFHLEDRWAKIVGKDPNQGVYLEELDFEVRASLMQFVLGEKLKNYSIVDEKSEGFTGENYNTFIFDKNGKFRKDAIRLKEK